MIGYYIPETMKMTESGASIKFISAADVDHVVDVMIRSSEDARLLAHNLIAQRDNGISNNEGKALSVTGILMLNPGRGDEGVIHSRDKSGETVLHPVKLHFYQDSEHAAPAQSICSAIGYERDGAFIVERAALFDMSPAPVVHHHPDASL